MRGPYDEPGTTPLSCRTPGAKPGAPTPEVAEAVAAAKHYFEGKKTDFSRCKLDLGEQDAFFERIYAAARQVGWGRTTTPETTKGHHA